MKLPKKYAGVTPGEWRAFFDRECQWHGIEGADGKHVAGVSSARQGEEDKANATIMGDSPRLAAAVVRLREALGEAQSLLEGYTGCSDGCTCGDGWGHIERHQMEPIRSALTETAEWEA